MVTPCMAVSERQHEMFRRMLYSRVVQNTNVYEGSLLHFEGHNGTTTIVDEGTVFNWSTLGATISTEQAKFGRSSLKLNTAVTDNNRIYALDNSFEFGTNDWTIDCWAYSTSEVNGYQTIISKDAVPSGYSPVSAMVRFYNPQSYPLILGSISGTTWDLSTGENPYNSGNMPINTWIHYAIVKSGHDYYVLTNGWVRANVGEPAGAGHGNPGTNTLWNNTANWVIGRFNNGSGATANPWVGYIDEFRIRQGVWFTNGSPVPTAPY